MERASSGAARLAQGEKRTMRGLWRWWVEKNGADTWWARVEVQPGEWRDVEQTAYERAGHAPPFWDLPLQEDYVADTLADPILEEERRIQREIEAPALIVLMLTFCVLFVVIVVGYVVLARLGLIS
ncbi:MAG: hypothetical protein A4S17_12045 [Proteobacteria bacterium HN_bin10]|jgi:hypothetical protein|nr:MAG: hypothetical protein A4S17_12045 [Proteobacteria bacterium HN_bin10]